MVDRRLIINNNEKNALQEKCDASEMILMPIVDNATKNDNINRIINERGEFRRQQIFYFLLKSTDLVNELRNMSLSAEHSKLRLIVPSDMLQKLEDGSWDLREAKDGSGLLPIAINSEDGKFTKQLRVKWTSDDLTAKTEMANMAAHAKTHALLKQVLEKLDVIDAKLDLVLANQHDQWRGQIDAGLQMIERVPANKQSLSHASINRLINAEQSIRVGFHTGIRLICNELSALSEKPNLFSSLRNLFGKSPSVILAEKLDHVIDDVKFLATGIRALIAISVLLEEESAQQEIFDFAKKITETFKQHNQLIRNAKFDRDREHFWTQNIPSLAMRQTTGNLAIEFETKEYLCINSEKL